MSKILFGGTLYEYVPAMGFDGVYITSIETNDKNLILPEKLANKTVIGIASRCLNNNTLIESIVIPKTYNTLKSMCFYNMSNLKSVEIQGNLLGNRIAGGLFKSCSRLESVTLPDSIEWISNGVFAGCTSLSSFICPKSLKTIGGTTFENSGIKNFYINEHLENIPLISLRKCPCEKIDVHPENKRYTSIDGVLYQKERHHKVTGEISTYLSLCIYPSSKQDKKYIPPSNVLKINSSSMIGNNFLESIIIPPSVKSIGYGFMSGLKNLKLIRIKSDNTKLECGAFAGISPTARVSYPYNYKYENVLLDDNIKPERNNELTFFIDNISTNTDKEVSI